MSTHARMGVPVPNAANCTRWTSPASAKLLSRRKLFACGSAGTPASIRPLPSRHRLRWKLSNRGLRVCR